MPHYFGVGDYRAIIADFSIELFMGSGFIPIAKAEMNRLNLAQLKSVNNYN